MDIKPPRRHNIEQMPPPLPAAVLPPLALGCDDAWCPTAAPPTHSTLTRSTLTLSTLTRLTLTAPRCVSPALEAGFLRTGPAQALKSHLLKRLARRSLRWRRVR